MKADNKHKNSIILKSDDFYRINEEEYEKKYMENTSKVGWVFVYFAEHGSENRCCIQSLPYKPIPSLEDKNVVNFKIDKPCDFITFKTTGKILKAEFLANEMLLSVVKPEEDGTLWFFGKGELFYLFSTYLNDINVKLYIEEGETEFSLYSDWYFIKPEYRDVYSKSFFQKVMIGRELNGEIVNSENILTYSNGSCRL